MSKGKKNKGTAETGGPDTVLMSEAVNDVSVLVTYLPTYHSKDAKKMLDFCQICLMFY